MHLFRDDNGEILAVCPDTILIPSVASLRKAVYAAAGSTEDPDNANRAFNYHVGRWTIIEWPYLNDYVTETNPAPFIILDSQYNLDNYGAAWFQREDFSIEQDKAPNDNLIHKGYERYGAGFNDWRFAAAGGISGGTSLSA